MKTFKLYSQKYSVRPDPGKTGTLYTGGKPFYQLLLVHKNLRQKFGICISIQATVQRPHVYDQKMPFSLKFLVKIDTFTIKIQESNFKSNPFFNIKIEGQSFLYSNNRKTEHSCSIHLRVKSMHIFQESKVQFQEPDESFENNSNFTQPEMFKDMTRSLHPQYCAFSPPIFYFHP